jgi:hypothetical protein
MESKSETLAELGIDESDVIKWQIEENDDGGDDARDDA